MGDRAPLVRPQSSRPNRKERCRHRTVWLIGGGAWAWCYACGALRPNRKTGRPAWAVPVGIGAPNPHDRYSESWRYLTHPDSNDASGRTPPREGGRK